MENFKVIIVEDVPLELKGTEGIFRNEIPEAEIIGTAESETATGNSSSSSCPTLSCSTSDWADRRPSAWKSAGRPSRATPM